MKTPVHFHQMPMPTHQVQVGERKFPGWSDGTEPPGTLWAARLIDPEPYMAFHLVGIPDDALVTELDIPNWDALQGWLDADA